MEHFQLSPTAPKGVLIDDITIALDKAQKAVTMVENTLLAMHEGRCEDISLSILSGVLWGVEDQLHMVSELSRHAFEAEASEQKEGGAQ